MDCLEETKWRPWISTFSFHDFSSWGQRAFCEPLSVTVSYLFRINLSQDWQLPYEERLGNLHYELTAVSSKHIISVDYFYFGISSYLIPGNVDRYQLPILQFYCNKDVIVTKASWVNCSGWKRHNNSVFFPRYLKAQIFHSIQVLYTIQRETTQILRILHPMIKAVLKSILNKH